jgi:hypothetical protein
MSPEIRAMFERIRARQSDPLRDYRDPEPQEQRSLEPDWSERSRVAQTNRSLDPEVI